MENMIRFLINAKPIRSIVFGLLFLHVSLTCAKDPNWPAISNGVLAIQNGDLDHGAELLRMVVRSDSRHLGNRSFSKEQNLTPSDIAHGTEQFRCLSIDRPAIVEHANANGFSSLSNWAIRRFAGEGIGFRVYWDSTTPSLARSGFLAEHNGPSETSRAEIRIAKHDYYTANGSLIGLDELWAYLVFELINIGYSAEGGHMVERVRNGTISRDDYVRESFLLEHKAMQRTHGFYFNHYLPWASRSGLSSDVHNWRLTTRAWWHSSEYFDRLPRDDIYPWKVYGDQFDKIREAATPIVTTIELSNRPILISPNYGYGNVVVPITRDH